MEWALFCDGVAKSDVYDVLATDEGHNQALANLDTIKDSVVWWSAGADTPQLLADGEVIMGSTYNGRLFSVIEEQKQPVAMLWDAQVFDLDGWIIPAGLSEERQAACTGLHLFATDTAASGRPSEIHLLRSCTCLICPIGWQARRIGHRNGATYANRS